MAQTTKIELTETYKKITTLPDFVVQNVHNTTVEIIFKDTAAVSTDRGMILNYGNAVSSSMISGTVYARSLSGSAFVAVTE